MSGTTVDAAADTAAATAAAAAAAAAASTTTTTETKPEGETGTKPDAPATGEEKKTGTALSTGKLDEAEEKSEDATTTKTEETAPVQYDIKAPEGVELDKTVIDSFVTEVAKAKNLTNEQAQAVVDYGLKREAEIAKASALQIAAEEKADLDLLRKDPELGGANFEKTLKEASRAFLKFATKEELAFIDATRLGNRAPMIRLFHRIALAFSEDTTAGAGGGQGGRETPSEEAQLRERYPSMFKEE